MSADDRSLVRFGSDAEADSTAESIERVTGVPVQSFSGVRDAATGQADHYLSVTLPVADVRRLASRTAAAVFSDAPLLPCSYRSISTIRADVARRIYAATGRGIVWAVIDSGIDATHPHFKRHANMELPHPLTHVDLTSPSGESDARTEGRPLIDTFGHGTYIAGIIAGENVDVRVAERAWDDIGTSKYDVLDVPEISGIAPECKIVSIKVLDDDGQGPASLVIQALARIQQMNSGRLRVHGVNIGLYYESDPERFACGRSPICVEAERLVRSGVVVVTAAGNTGYGTQKALARTTKQGMEASINDPGNAELTITVGSTDRQLPQVYGVSYFSSKGPTLDGRPKPDLVAPGERIVSCAAGRRVTELRDEHKLPPDVLYIADNGTSVAAAHVSGAAAALLSARPDLVGDAGAVKAVLMNSAADLGRSPFYQGRGVVDVLQALQQNFPRQGQTPTSMSMPSAVTSPPFLAAPIAAPAVNRDAARPLRVMYSYSHQDEVFKDELHTALAALRREGAIDVWQDRQILPGSEFDKDIAAALEASDIIILLVSKYFIASDYSWGIEMKRAVERHANGTASVVPVILKPADWKTSPFGKLTALPKDGKPIVDWQNPDAAWADVAEGVRRLVTAKRTQGRA